MNKKAKTAVSVFLVACLAMNAPSAAFAAASLNLQAQVFEVQPRYTFVDSVDCSIMSLGNNKASVSYALLGSSQVTKIVASAVVQVKSASGSYTTAKTLASKTFNSTDAEYATTVSIDSGKTYRLKVTFKVYQGKIVENISTYSNDT